MTDQVENPGGVTGKTGHLREGGVTPQDDLVLRVSMCADNLVGAPRPRQVTHLKRGREVNAVDEDIKAP